MRNIEALEVRTSRECLDFQKSFEELIDRSKHCALNKNI